MRDKLNCPNCGAPIIGVKCDYCGTLFYDFANMELNKANYLRMKIENNLWIFKAVPTEIELEHTSTEDSAYMNGKQLTIKRTSDYSVTIKMKIVANDKDVLLEIIERK